MRQNDRYATGRTLAPWAGEGIRMAPFGHYLIFYTVGAENIRVERIIHGARNIPVLFDA